MSVFKLYPQFLSSASDDDLATVVAGLKERNIALAIGFGILHQTSRCGIGVEGYNGSGALRASERIKKAAGKLAYVAADEPLFFGHDFNGTNACHADLAALAQDAAGTAKLFQAAFPGVKIIDVEPISNFKETNWRGLLESWHSAFRQAYGAPFAALHADIVWTVPWQSQVFELYKFMRDVHMPLGVIYNGNPGFVRRRVG